MLGPMSRIEPLWRSDALSVHRFDHPAEHEDRPYEEVSTRFMASFVEAGAFTLEARGKSYRVAAGDVMLQRPGLVFRAGFEGEAFNDTCLTLTYLSAEADAFDEARAGEWSWAGSKEAALPRSNRLLFLRWTLRRALADNEPMAIEYCASEIFRDRKAEPAALFADHKFAWYAERVHAARETLDRRFAEPHTVGALARDAGMSLFHFTRIFAELAGAPPHRYLREARLKAARAMLREGRSVTETCHAVGFNNLSHFTRSFAQRYGAAPSRAFA